MSNSTAPPATADLLAAARQVFVPVYQPRAVVLDHGRGARLWDREGREYVDFAAGIAVCGLGHADPELVAALVAQAGKLWHTSNVFYNQPAIELAQALVDSAPFARRVFLCNSGAEANEAAIKLARRRAAQSGRAPERRTILSFHGSFHGRTLATVTATAQPKYQQGFEPLPSGFRHAPFNDLDAAAAAMADGSVCAVLVEPVQGEGGVMPAAPGFLAGLRALCDRHNALLVCDEIQCGMGRTGTLFAHAQDDVVPDAVTLAKALGAGFPIGALLVGAGAAEVLQHGAHGTTFGGNPLAAAVARVALRRLSDPALLAAVGRRGAELREGLQRIGRDTGAFVHVRGRGLMLGAVLAEAHRGRAGALVDHALAAGLLVLQAGPDVLRLVPPLVLDDADAAAGLARLRVAIDAWQAARGGQHAASPQSERTPESRT